MMITRDDPPLRGRSGFPPPAMAGPPAGDRTVRVQVTCQRGRRRLSQLEPALRFRLVSAVVRLSSSRRCSTRVFAISGFMMTPPRACLLVIETIYLDCSLIKIYLEICACVGLSARRGMRRPRGSCGLRPPRLGSATLRCGVCGVLRSGRPTDKRPRACLAWLFGLAHYAEGV